MNKKLKPEVAKKTNNSPLFQAFALLILIFMGIIAFISTNIFLSQKRINSEDFFHVLMNGPQGHQDRGFNQQAIEGVCLANQIPLGNCVGNNSQAKEFLSYSYSGTMANSGVIYKHLMHIYRTEKKKNFIMPGFTNQSFVDRYIRDLEKLGINIIAIDTFWKPNPKEEWAENLWQFSFNHYFAGYHAGLYAGAYALLNSAEFKDGNPDTPDVKEIKFASLGGLPIPPIYNYAIGFKYGLEMIDQNRNDFVSDTNVRLVNTNFEIIGGFNPLINGPNATVIADRLLSREGVSVIFNIAVSLTSTILNSVEKANSRSKYKHFVIGVDVDQGITIKSEPEEKIDPDSKILTSAIIKIDTGIAKVVKRIHDKEKPTGSIYYSGHDLNSIPNRFKSTAEGSVWKKVESVLGSATDLEEALKTINQTTFLFVQIVLAILGTDTETEKYVHSQDERKAKLNELLKSEDSFIAGIDEFLVFANEKVEI